jgi:hypothetical protein
MRRMLVVVLFAALVLSPSARARAPEAEGQAPFGFSAWFGDPPRTSGAIRLWFSMAGMQFDTSATGVAHIVLPPGMELVSGDTLHTGQPAGRGNNWRLIVVPRQAGDYEIKGTLRITSKKSQLDEADLVLHCRIEADTAVVEDPRVTRLETVRRGQRYRYGGRYLVPIAAPQSVVQREIDQSGGKARPTSFADALCPHCGLSGEVRVPYVVFLDAAGSVIDLRPRREIPAAVDSAGRAAIRGWRFAPSHVHGKPVADWIMVEVPVRAR